MKQLSTLLVLLALAAPAAVFADIRPDAVVADQGQRVSGVVQDADGNPVIGATITAVSSATNQVLTGSYTDAQGRFTLTLSSSQGVIIRVTYVGYKTVELQPGENLSIVLEADNIGVDDVIVQGYTTQSRRFSLQAVGQVDGKDFENMPVTGFDRAIQGRIAGVQVSSSNGLAGTFSRVQIRGLNSINNSTAPLYVVDGVVIGDGGIGSGSFATTQGGGSNPLADINPNDIETVSVLKDAAAVAKYGSRGANGVVVITTRQGLRGEPTTFNVNYEVGFVEPANTIPLMNATQYRDFLQASYLQNGLDLINDFGFSNTGDTDWQDAIFRTGFSQRAGVSARGGSEKTTFFISADVIDREEYMHELDYTRFTGRVNLEHRINDKWTIGTNTSIARTRQGRTLTDNAVQAPFSSAVLAYPNIPIFDANPTGTNPYELGFGNNALGNIAVNPLALLNFETVEYSNVRLITNNFVQFKPIADLTIRQSFGFSGEFTNDFTRRSATMPFSPTGEGEVIDQTGLYWISTTQADYTRTFGDHTIGATAGFSYETQRTSFQFQTAVDFPGDAVRNIGGAATVTDFGANGSEWGLQSFYGIVNYRYKDRYLLEGSVRNDKGSFFGPDSRSGTFGSVAVGWIFSEESFLDGLTWLDYGKIRVSYGTAGNRPSGNFDFLTLFAPGADAGVGDVGGLIPSQIGNPDLQWETSVLTDVGIELGLFGIIRMDLSYFNRNTTDLLFNVPLPDETGFGAVTTNADFDLINQGVELNLSSVNVKSGDFTWETNFNVTWLENRIENLPLDQEITSGEYRIENNGRIDAWYLVEWHGLSATGQTLYNNLDGTTRTGFDANQRRIAGNANPNWFGGITNTFTYKDFQLEFLFTFAFDYDVYNATRQFLSDHNNGFNKWEDLSTRSFDIEGAGALYPGFANANWGTFNSSDHTFWLEKGDHVRLRHVRLAYNLPKDLIATVGLKNVQVYAQGFNLLLITPYSGIDPETNFNSTQTGLGAVQLSREFLTPPQARSYVFGVNISF